MASQVDRAFVPWWEAGDLSAIAPPPGETSNFKNPYSRAWLDVLTLSVCWTVGTLAIAMRMYTKLGILRNPGWDDYTALIAYFLLLAFGIVCLVGDHHGNGRHLWNVTGYEFVAFAKAAWAEEIIYGPAMLFTKLSIFLLYLRVFNPIMRTSVVLYVFLWLNVTFYFCGAFVQAFQCMPVAKAWLPLMDGHCLDQQALEIASAVINAVSDFIVLVLPAGSIWNLHIHRQGKIGLFIIFSFGILGCVASVARCVVLGKAGKVTHNIDGTWTLYPLNLLATAELTCGLICSCLPALPAFLRQVSGIKIRVMISNEKPHLRGANGYRTYPPDPRSPGSHGHQHRHRDGHTFGGGNRAANGVKRASKFFMNAPPSQPSNGLQSSLSPSDSASKANSGSTNQCSHCSHCRQDRQKAIAAANAVPVSPSPEKLNVKERKAASSSSFFFSPPTKSGAGPQDQLALHSIGGRPLPPLPPAPGSIPQTRRSSFTAAAAATEYDAYEDSNEGRYGVGFRSPVLMQSPTSGRDPYEELDALTYEDGDEWRSPSEAEAATSVATTPAAVGLGTAGNRWNDGGDDSDDGHNDNEEGRDYFGAAPHGGGGVGRGRLGDLEKGSSFRGGGSGGTNRGASKLAKLGFRP